MQCLVRKQKKHQSYVFVSFENDIEPPKNSDSRALVYKWFNKDVRSKCGRQIYETKNNLPHMIKTNKLPIGGSGNIQIPHFVQVGLSLDTVT